MSSSLLMMNSQKGGQNFPRGGAGPLTPSAGAGAARHQPTIEWSNKKISYCRETACQLHTPFSARSLIVHFTEHCTCYLYNYTIDKLNLYPHYQLTNRATYALSLESAFKVISGHPYWCRHKSRTVCGRNVQLMPTKIWQWENGKFVHFSDPTQVWWRRSKKRLRISTNFLYCQKLGSLPYIFAADNIGLCLLLFTQLSLKLDPLSLKLLVQNPSFTWYSHSRSF